MQIDCNQGRLLGVNSGYGIFYRSSLYSNWIALPGGLKHVSLDSDGTVWGANLYNQVWQCNLNE